MNDLSITSTLEAVFDVSELFFSHTDQRGIIRFGNDVFIRVSEFTSEEILSKPHNIIRHPDMPKCVFKLLWSYLLNNQPIVAYVKNKSKSGKYYWVLALAFPYKNGFLSIRLKPTSSLLEAVVALYKKLLMHEQAKGMESAFELLIDEVKKIGFSDYSAFMRHALVQEIHSREAKLKQKSSNNKVDHLFRLSQHAESISKNILIIEEETKNLGKKFSEIKEHCINLTIKAENYGQKGATIEQTAIFFNKWGNDILRVLEEFSKKQADFIKTLTEAKEKINFSYLQTAMSESFRSSKNLNSEYEQGLNEMSLENILVCRKYLLTMQDSFDLFVHELRNLSESIVAMKIVQLSGKIESSHLPDNGKFIESTVANMVKFIEATEASIKKLNTYASTTHQAVSSAAEVLQKL